MKFIFCGGAREIGASCILVRIDDKNILFDCGMRMGGTKDILPDFRIIQENGGVDAIFVSHAHMDHSGSLPVISREYPNAKIYMTHITKDLIKMLLYDSLKIMEIKESEIPVFAEVHVENMLNRIVCFSPGYTFNPFGTNLKATFYSAGHVAGAVGIYISGQEGTIFYSGDFSVTRQRTVEGASIPKLRPDIALFESTYGDRLHASRENEENKLVEKIKEVIQSGNKILIPAFALGRAQEIILILKRAINRGTLPQFKIYIDGMVKDVCRVYSLNPNYLRNQLAKKAFKGEELFYDDNIIAVTGRQAQRESIINSKDPCCIISSSGMLNGGPSQWYAEKLALGDGNYIAITGYQDEESPGRQLLDLIDAPENQERFLKIGEKTLLIKCGIGRYGLSAHADKTEIVSLVHALSAKNVFFVHGNDQTITSFAADIQKEYKGRIHAPVNGDLIEINIHNPRKQILKSTLKTMNQFDKLTENNIKILWEFTDKHYGVDRAFTLEEILFMWNGKEDQEEEALRELADLIYKVGYFEAETRRPFMYKAMTAQAIKEKEESKSDFMEVNAMLLFAEDSFPEQAGLYKKGAMFEEKTALLYFNFPMKAESTFKKEIEEFQEITGWKVQINSDCNLSAAQNLVAKLIPRDVSIIGSPSYFRNENLVKTNISGPIKDNMAELIEKEFFETSGISLELVHNGQKRQSVQRPVEREDYQMEQNQALAVIDMAFKDKEHRVYKKGIKNVDGEIFIELSFISPSIADKYQDLLDELESLTRWHIRINPNPNQNDLINLGSQLFRERNITLKRNISYLPKEMIVKAKINECADAEVLDQIKDMYIEKTGIEMIVE